MSNDTNCQEGSRITDALKLLRERGVPRWADFNVECATTVPSSVYQSAVNFKIDDYTTLFWIDDTAAKKIATTKKAISQNRPVVVGMGVYNSFFSAKDRWNGIKDAYQGNHAMCVVAYDDEKYGGAFLLMNSWGTYWGNGGFTWVTYHDFCQHTHYGGEMFVRPRPRPQPIPEPVPTPQPAPKPVMKNTLAGGMQLLLSTGDTMRVTFVSSELPHYQAEGEYISGTRYRIYVSNNAPAYVYVIGSDLLNNVSKVFPPTNDISPALTYSQNNIAIPDEQWFIEMDNTKGKDYLCVLYSAESLPIDDIVGCLKSLEGTFYDKLKRVLGEALTPNTEMKMEQNRIAFNAKTNATVVPLIVEVTHR